MKIPLIIYYEIVKSTQDLAWTIGKEFNEVIVMAGSQEAGRGRWGRSWWSPKGGLWFSYFFRPNISTVWLKRLPLIGGLAVLRSLSKILKNFNIMIKWPNDILLNGKKVAGILVEAKSVSNTICEVVIGIGINTNLKNIPKDLIAHDVTSTLIECKCKIDNVKLLIDIITEFKKLLELSIRRGRWPFIVDEINSNLAYKKSEVSVIYESGVIKGVLIEVDSEGRLVIMSDGKFIKILEGSIKKE